MPRATDGSLLPDDDWNQLQEIADRFAEARQKGPADLESFLPPEGQPLRRPVLLELIKIDLEMTWRQEGRALVETYETLYPDLAPAPLDLIVEEYRIRHRVGDKPALDEYQVRFPDQFEQIEQRIRERPPQASAPKFQKPTEPAAPAEQTPPITSLFPPGYTPIEMIGRGNFAEVWRAEAPGGIAVAVKIISQPLDNEGAQREQKALELIKRLQHPMLLSTTAFWVIQNRLVIVMELADSSLRDRLRECKAKGLAGIPFDELLSYFRDVAAGLDWLHWQGVLHRDIKPENILLKKGYAKVADFGLARSGPAGVLVSSSFAGTPAFMAPEVWGNKVSKQSDQYSLAFTYAQLRMGRRPLEGTDFVQVMNSALHGVPNLEGLPHTEQTVLRRALAKRPEERFDSCQDFVEALERALSPEGRASRRRPNPEPTQAKLSPSAQGSPTEHTQHAVPPPKKVIDSGDKTYQQATVPKMPVVWKPPGPKPAESGGRVKLILAVIVGVLLLAGGAALAYMMFGGSTDGRTTTSDHVPPTSPRDRPRPTTNSISVADPVKFELPAGFVADEQAKPVMLNGKKYAERIVYRFGSGEAGFLLLRPDNGPPFYLAENKVTNSLFQTAREKMPGGKTAWLNDGPQLPALSVTWSEARRCAQEMGGDLPTPEQLDFAAGFSRRDGRPGPANGPRVAIKITKPLPVNRPDNDDISPLGVRDLGGNGREWTRKTITANGEELAILRGRMYTLSKPLTYEQLAREQNDRDAQTQRPSVPSSQTGFRIVVEIK